VDLGLGAGLLPDQLALQEELAELLQRGFGFPHGFPPAGSTAGC
jgi:hypothetical protein